MVLADSNIWLALALSKHAFHAAARDSGPVITR
jgi:predicted nucleic acid-binding protein